MINLTEKNNNRLKELRKKKGKTLDDIELDTKIKRGTFSNYENGKTEPKLEVWEKLANYFDVPVSYLQGISDDPNGWNDWANATGHSVSQIKKEIKRMTDSNRIDKNENIQKIIGQAVENLEGQGQTDKGVINNLQFAISQLGSTVNNAYIDPKKKEQFKVNPGSELDIYNYPNGIKDIIYDDMSVEVYDEIFKILQNTRAELYDLISKYHLH